MTFTGLPLQMSQQFNWDSQTVGVVQSSFFWLVPVQILQLYQSQLSVVCCWLSCISDNLALIQGLPADASAGRRVGGQVWGEEGARVWRDLVEHRHRHHTGRCPPGPGAAAGRQGLHGHRRGRRHASHEQHALPVGHRPSACRLCLRGGGQYDCGSLNSSMGKAEY